MEISSASKLIVEVLAGVRPLWLLERANDLETTMPNPAITMRLRFDASGSYEAARNPLRAVLATNSEFADKKTARQLMVG